MSFIAQDKLREAISFVGQEIAASPFARPVLSQAEGLMALAVTGELVASKNPRINGPKGPLTSHATSVIFTVNQTVGGGEMMSIAGRASEAFRKVMMASMPVLFCGLICALLVIMCAAPALAQAEPSDSVITGLPDKFNDPAPTWIMEVTWVIAFLALLVIFVRQSIRAGELTFWTLLFISATTMHWQEWPADWGTYLIYNPDFHLMPWDSSTWTTPNKPWFMLASYACYFVPVYALILWLTAKLRARYTHLGLFAAAFIVAYPLFYIWNLLVEGGSSLLGWWTYTDHFGPAILSDRGTWPILYPVGWFAFTGVVFACLLSLRGPDGRARWESWFRVQRIRAGWRRELARVGAWSVVMNAAYMLLVAMPFVLVREIWGSPNSIVP